MFTLVIGDKNLSSWSLRCWLALRHLGIEFREVKLALDTPEFHGQISQFSGALRVPVLIDGELRIWDSLAILEYANEKAQGRGWPADPALRALARSVSAEMHSGFMGLRQTWSMKTVGTNPNVPLTDTARADVERIQTIWAECRQRHAALGPWLFGQWSYADAMYAPVVLRFRHYGASLSPVSRAYYDQTLTDPHLQQWIRDAEQEVAAH
jgi:glutathione S-transferase